MEKPWALDSIAKGWRAKKISVFPLSQCVLCCSDCNIYFEQPILCPECCCKQQSSWDRLVSGEGKNKQTNNFFCFFVLSPGRARFRTGVKRQRKELFTMSPSRESRFNRLPIKERAGSGMSHKASETTSTSTTRLAQKLLMNAQCSGGSRSFAKETRALRMRSSVASCQKLTVAN